MEDPRPLPVDFSFDRPTFFFGAPPSVLLCLPGSSSCVGVFGGLLDGSVSCSSAAALASAAAVDAPTTDAVCRPAVAFWGGVGLQGLDFPSKDFQFILLWLGFRLVSLCDLVVDQTSQIWRVVNLSLAFDNSFPCLNDPNVGLEGLEGINHVASDGDKEFVVEQYLPPRNYHVFFPRGIPLHCSWSFLGQE